MESDHDEALEQQGAEGLAEPVALRVEPAAYEVQQQGERGGDGEARANMADAAARFTSFTKSLAAQGLDPNNVSLK